MFILSARRRAIFTLGALAVGAPAGAQAVLTPSSMVNVTCEYVKAGMGPAHDKNEEKWARAAEAIKGFPPSLAIQSVTGPAASCWLTTASSYEQIGKNSTLFETDPTYSKLFPSLIGADAQYISDTRSYIARLRTDLSAGAMPNILTRKFTMWSEWRIRPGQEALFEKAAKAYAAAMKRAGVDPEFRIFQVLQGAPGATIWIFTSRSSMAGFDKDMADDPKIGAAFTPDDQKLFDEFFSKAVVSMSENLWNYSPAQSNLTAEQRATDPFWKLKPAAKP